MVHRMAVLQNISDLQNELIQTTTGLSEEGLRTVIEMVRTIIMPYDIKLTAVKSKPAQQISNRIGSRKGVKFIADGHSIDEYDGEIEELFGVND